MRFRTEQIEKYEHYARLGRSVFSVTLSTFVVDDSLAKSDVMRKVWQHHFLYRVTEGFPYKDKSKIDYDYVIERSPDIFAGAGVLREAGKDEGYGFFHYHGFLAVPAELESRMWRDGQLHPRLDRALASFQRVGKHRPFPINAYLIEPVKSATQWAMYYTKTYDYIPSTC